MDKLISLGIACLVLALSGCAVNQELVKDIRLETEKHPRANLAGYKTYSWIGSTALVIDPGHKIDSRGFNGGLEFEYLVNKKMRELGFSQLAQSRELGIAYTVGVVTDIPEIPNEAMKQLKLLGDKPAIGLRIVAVDMATQTPVWAGGVVGNFMQERSDEEAQKRLKYVVDGLFSDFIQPASEY
ncbi:hypothetical protein A3762_06700 [Oleiphilus sp. HI0125]|uniref:DUF4136 domain-containing protein n=1 Tax=Oleiphilus sp. HI0125 TaxID=1822266 RepID=UPI0007C2C2C6|nr:DUF4136 domain-containing protein [Oleiphilus sp. HI0125]KZZ58681.1 hypothetical protein A3762_06700 [Oleiphilus sp. HI0125]